MISQLEAQKRIQPLVGFGYDGVAVMGTRKQLLAMLSRGLRTRKLAFSPENGPVEWPPIELAKHMS